MRVYTKWYSEKGVEAMYHTISKSVIPLRGRRRGVSIVQKQTSASLLVVPASGAPALAAVAAITLDQSDVAPYVSVCALRSSRVCCEHIRRVDRGDPSRIQCV